MSAVSVVSGVFVCVFVCLSTRYSRTVRDIVTKFSGHHLIVKREAAGWRPLANDNEIIDEYDNGYIGPNGARVVIKRSDVRW